jgi:uncharacterized protein YecE (DUF72 family)
VTATTNIFVGTASWTDKTLIKSGAFYPREIDTAESRLRFYARHFSTVEVDSTYYALPSEKNATLWVERTPQEFVFHIKAYSMLTGHPTLVKTIPRQLREGLPQEALTRSQIKDFPREWVLKTLDLFRTALTPLKAAGKLGCILFQFPPWFVPSSRAYAWMETLREKLPGHQVAVEFRNTKWLSTTEIRRSTDFLKNQNICYVAVDAPWIPRWEGPAPVTASVAYVRLHGRNRENWFKKGIETAQRYRYLYTEAELEAWTVKLREASTTAQKTFVLFNNCFEDYGIRNAMTFRDLVRGHS